MSLLLAWLSGCKDDPAKDKPTPAESPVTVGDWVDLGWCEVWEGPPTNPLPAPTPAQCTPAVPGWTSGPVEAWAQAVIRGIYRGDTLGYDIAALDPDGDGEDALAVGVPHLDLSGVYFAPPENEIRGPRVHLLSDLAGTVWPGDDSVLVSEWTSTNSTGQSVEALTSRGPVLIGDYWQAGYVSVVDVSTSPPTETQATGEQDHDCGSDVGVADVDGSGSPDILAACLNALNERGHIEVYSQDDSGSWQFAARLQGTTPDAWFGRPTRSGFDLNRDGWADVAIGEEHIGENLESVVYLVSKPFRGECTLEDVGAVSLWNGFAPAQLEAADLDGDGVGELLVTEEGQPAWELNPTGPPGWVRVLRETVAEDTPVQDVSWLTFEGGPSEEGFGASVASGDFNGDGCADVAVGAPGSSLNAHNPPGKVYVFYGPFDGGTVPSTSADVVLEGGSDWDHFGFPLETGDFNGDGIDDLAVSAIWDSQVQVEAGAVYILAGQTGAP